MQNFIITDAVFSAYIMLVFPQQLLYLEASKQSQVMVKVGI